ncbi:hypothetical protein PR202_ga00046 [Eleusine coracana subsp. coracana]|uniref:Uncharacterized protein n=1 Tax=Eleusine coracana subsp. coracana TaxID=191504 RepID=A0AAV5BGG1_ELECO|nr:hypothetical protein PR202_ga00046 [Eleusine coracana subsp. coracana]
MAGHLVEVAVLPALCSGGAEEAAGLAEGGRTDRASASLGGGRYQRRAEIRGLDSTGHGPDRWAIGDSLIPSIGMGVCFDSLQSLCAMEVLQIWVTAGDLVDDREDHREVVRVPDQVTEFVAGGIAVGVALHHTAADGRGLWRFIQTWAAAAAGSPVSQLGTALHDRRLVHFQGDEDLANFFLKHVAPELPRIAPKQDALPAGQRPSLSRRTFTLPSSAVRRLKQQLATAPSTFAAVVAHGWVSIARAKGFTDDSPVYAFFLADLRAHMTPPVPDAYIGNCLAVCSVVLSGAELTGSDGPTRACSAIKDAVAEVKREPLADPRGWMSKFTEAPPGRGIVMAGSPWFPAYGIDFGFGKPARVELASMNHDGEMVLVAGKEPGSVQASVALSADKMPAFCEVFVVES